MINENKELIITTPEAMEVIRIIKKINMKDAISNAIKQFSNLNAKKENKLTELRALIIKTVGFETYENLSEIDKEEETKQILNQNQQFKMELEKTMIEVNREITSLGMELIYDFVMRIPDAEKEIYKCLSKIFNKPLKEVENQEVDITIEQVKDIAQSKTLMSFFNLATM